jgi:hypothetical protein
MSVNHAWSLQGEKKRGREGEKRDKEKEREKEVDKCNKR